MISRSLSVIPLALLTLTACGAGSLSGPANTVPAPAAYPANTTTYVQVNAPTTVVVAPPPDYRGSYAPPERRAGYATRDHVAAAPRSGYVATEPRPARVATEPRPVRMTAPSAGRRSVDLGYTPRAPIEPARRPVSTRPPTQARVEPARRPTTAPAPSTTPAPHATRGPSLFRTPAPGQRPITAAPAGPLPSWDLRSPPRVISLQAKR